MNNMTELADQLRTIKLDKYIEFMLLGDPVKLLLVPLWAEPSVLPGVYQTSYNCAGDSVRCNLWDLADNADATCRMFPMDGTVNTGFDYCIIVYDTITRVKKEELDKWITIKDQICSRQHPERQCELVVLVVKAPRTPSSKYSHIEKSCAKLKIHLIPVDNTKDGLDKIRSLLERLANLVYQKRKAKHHERIAELLSKR